MLGFFVCLKTLLWSGLASSAAMVARFQGGTRSMRREEGQTTAEYALVILAAAAVAVVLIAWARSSGKLPAFFDKIIDDISQLPP
jgi:Flp pilus assembly pilin Flp